MRISTHRHPGLIVHSHRFQVPLNHSVPDGDKIAVFARELLPANKPDSTDPYIVYLQGGPGFACRPPISKAGWIKQALKRYRVLLLDQRGTGQSTPVCDRTLIHLPPQEQASYLQFFRADSIVKDAEWIRRILLGEKEKWTIIGQSFGGFCAVHYLSAAPEGLAAVMITGGLPPLQGHADLVYQATSRRVVKRNERFYRRYPEDKALVQRIVSYLDDNEVTLPGGTKLTPRVFQQLGMRFGMSSAFEDIHYLLQTAFLNGPSGPELSYRFLRGMQNRLPFETNPIYAILHEAIYCQGEASKWSAHRVTNQLADFQLHRQPLFFTGEMVYPWMFDDYVHLRPLAAAAHLIAQKNDWPMLYDMDVLRTNEVPCAAVVYYDDMYVERGFSMETADSIQNMRVWVTSEYDHNGLSVNGSGIFDHLSDLLSGER